MTSKKATYLILIVLFLFITICGIFISINYLVKIETKRTNYDELTYYDFMISYDDDNYCYEIFTNNKKYIIRESQLNVKYDDATYIVIFDNNYDWYYNKAILFIGFKTYDK